LLAAVLTMGEGYHNYHHTFPTDYRNGSQCHHYDPTKWILWACARLGIAKNLKRTPASAIARARLRMDQQRLARRGISSPWSERVEQASHALHQILVQWSSLSRQRRRVIRCKYYRTNGRTRGALERQLRIVRRSFHRRYRDWRVLLQRADRERLMLARTSLHPSSGRPVSSNPSADESAVDTIPRVVPTREPRGTR
jgi:stearoyl-CoA desaturase (delta-9 desaturase)